MTVRMLGVALATGILFVSVAQTPARAESAVTDVFVTNLAPNLDFLDEASRLALDQSKNSRLKTFAREQATEQTLAANDLDEWIRADRAANIVLAQIAAEAARPEGDLQTGRSVAIDEAPGATTPVDTRQPLGQADFDALKTLSGTAFDAQYKRTQLEGLRQVEADYATYIVKGDDPILLSIVNRELPKVRHRIEQLRNM